MSICNYLVQRSKQIKRYHDWTDLLLVTLFLRTIADCSTADFLFFVLPFLFAVLPSFFPSAVFTNSAQRLWTVFPKCRDWRSMSPCITSSLFSGCSNLEDRASYWKLWLRQAQQSVPRSCFFGMSHNVPHVAWHSKKRLRRRLRPTLQEMSVTARGSGSRKMGNTESRERQGIEQSKGWGIT